MNRFGNFGLMNNFNNFGMAGRVNNMNFFGLNGLNNFMKPCFNNNLFAFWERKLVIFFKTKHMVKQQIIFLKWVNECKKEFQNFNSLKKKRKKNYTNPCKISIREINFF